MSDSSQQSGDPSISNQGFQNMDPERQRNIASKGGLTTQAKAHGQSLDEYVSGGREEVLGDRAKDTQQSSNLKESNLKPTKE